MAGLRGLHERRDSLDSTETVRLRLSNAQGSLRQNQSYRQEGEIGYGKENAIVKELEEELVLNGSQYLLFEKQSSS